MISTSRAMALAQTDTKEVEALLRERAAPIIEFLEEASKIDGGYPDRYEGPRDYPFDVDSFHHEVSFRDRPGFTLNQPRVWFTTLDDKGRGGRLTIDFGMENHALNAGGDPSMSIILYGDGFVEYQGASNNLDNSPPRGPHPLAKDKHWSFGIWRTMSLIVDTYYYYSFEPTRLAALSKLAGDIQKKYFAPMQHENYRP